MKAPVLATLALASPAAGCPGRKSSSEPALNGVAAGNAGDVYTADALNWRIRRVDVQRVHHDAGRSAEARTLAKGEQE